MTNPMIVCNINMFDANQTVTVMADGKQANYSVPTEELVRQIPNICYSENAYNVHLFGNELFITPIAETIISNENLCYGKNQISVEVN